MTELERALLELGRELAFPEAPDVSGRVVRLVEAGPPRRRRPGRRALALVAAALALALAAAFAVPQARTAILELFGLRGATVQRVQTLPELPDATAASLGLGSPAALPAGALVPAALGPPDAVYVSPESYGRRLTLVYEPGPGVPRSPFTGVGLLVSEFAGESDPGFVDKLVTGGTTVARLRVGPYDALWLEGGRHGVLFKDEQGAVFEDRGRLAGNTLLVDRDGVLVRIEGEVDRQRAVEIARSLEPR